MEQFKASDRELCTWYSKINLGEIKLPRFQRFEAWDRKRITSLLQVIANNLPLGITLILKVGYKSQFIDRYIETAPENDNDVSEHLLDGQQRLTAFWRLMNNNYENETYYLYLLEWDKDKTPPNEENILGFCQPRWVRKTNGIEKRFPLWADDPQLCYQKGLLPSNLLKPVPIESEIENWINLALMDEKPNKDDLEYANHIEQYFNTREKVKNNITSLREIINHYNLPYLQLSSNTHKDTALSVFINMNTNSKPLSIYDIVVAEVESVKGTSLHDLIEELDNQNPNIKNYFDLDDLTLYTSALLQDKLPNQKGIVEMDKIVMIDNWKKVVNGLNYMVSFLESQCIYDRQRLPTNSVLAVIAALNSIAPNHPDKKGNFEILMKKYIWRSFFTDRYENSTATRAIADYKALKGLLLGEYKDKEKSIQYSESDVPVFNDKDFPVATYDELKSVKWPKQENTKGRAIIAVSSILGAYDLADGIRISRENIKKRDYHHIYPDALLKEAQKDSFYALNCALISGGTNKSIGRKDPLTYLKDRYDWTDQEIVDQRLKSHLIPINELANGGYSDLTEEDKKRKIINDFDNFLTARAKLIEIAAHELCDGKNITYSEIFNLFSKKLEEELKNNSEK